MSHVLTRNDCASQLPADSDPLVVSLHLAVTAADRHASRVAAVESAVRAAFPTATDRQIGVILALEAGDGVGGKGGYAGGSTARMRWAARCGKGRRHATDGDAWTLAIKTASVNLMSRAPDVDDIRDVADLLTEDDLAWPLSYALRAAADARFRASAARAWAELARSVASRCEPDSYGGRLAQRYDLPTLAPLYVGLAVLREDTVAELLGRTEIPTLAGQYNVGSVTVDLLRTTSVRLYESSPTLDVGWHVRVATRKLDPSEINEIIRRAWEWREGAEEEFAIASLHEQLLGSLHAPDVLTAWRAAWDAADGYQPEPNRVIS